MGMLTALGYSFRDADGRQLYGCGRALAQIHAVHRSRAPRTGRHRTHRRERRPQPVARHPRAHRRSSDPRRAPDPGRSQPWTRAWNTSSPRWRRPGFGTAAALAGHDGRRKRRRTRLRVPAARGHTGLRCRLLPGPAGLQHPQGQLRRRHHRRRQPGRTDPGRQTARRRRPALRIPSDHRRRRPLAPPPGAVGRNGPGPGLHPGRVHRPGLRQ